MKSGKENLAGEIGRGTHRRLPSFIVLGKIDLPSEIKVELEKGFND